jgi:hypothetical protein
VASDQNAIAGRVLGDFGLTIAPVRDLVRERLGVGSSSLPEARLRFSSEASGALRSAYRFGLGGPGTEHMLIVIVRRGEGGACELLRALGVDPNTVRFETKKRAWPSSRVRRRAGPAVRHVGSVQLLRELDFED